MTASTPLRPKPNGTAAAPDTTAASCRVNDRPGHAAGGMPQHRVRRVAVLRQPALAGVVSRRGLPADRTSPRLPPAPPPLA